MHINEALDEHLALKLQIMFVQWITTHRIFKRLAMALIRRRVCAG